MSGLFDCVICLGLLSETKYSNPCGHVFCEQCLEDYLGYAPTDKSGATKDCPICKARLSGSTLKPPAREYELVYRMSRVQISTESLNQNVTDNTIHNLFVKTITGKTINIPPKAGVKTKISEIKTVIDYYEGIKPSEQLLIYGGKNLDDSKTLEDYGITENATIHLTARLLGGAYLI